MPLIDDILNGLHIQIDTLWYNLLYSLAGIGWGIQRAVLMMGYTLELMNQWLVEQAFMPLIAQTNASLQVAVSASFAVALIVLGITYLLAAFARIRVVEPRSAIAWYLAGAVFFALGPQLYQGMGDLRRELAQGFYASSLSGLQATTGTAFSSLNAVSSSELGLVSLCDNLGSYLPVWNPTIDGLDVALAYLRADGIDLMGYPSVPRDPACQPHTPDPLTGEWSAGVVPWEWRRPGSFFANDRDPVFFPDMTAEERLASLSLASSANGRLLTAWPLILFGVGEQLVYLLLTIAQGLTFLSFGVAILFAFFKKTEVIARSIIDLWIELVVQTVIIALIQGLIVTVFLAGTATQNGVVILGIGLICLVFMLIVLWSGVKAVWNALNRLFNAFGQVSGGTVVTPAAAVGTAVLGGAAAAVSAASIGSSALAGMSALQSGATPAQAAGLALGGVSSLSGAARSLMHLPALRGTALGDAAEQFSEGAATRRIAGPMIGRLLLSDRDPERERGAMLVPAVGERLASWTQPLKPRPDDLSDVERIEDDRPQRMGRFTPSSDDRRTYADDQRGEELETHLTERLGSLRVSGRDDIASVMGDVMRLLSGHGGMGVDHLSVGLTIAQALGVTPNGDTPPVRDDLARFGLFIEQAARLGLSPDQTTQAAREINTTPDRRLPPETRTQWLEQGVKSGMSRDEAERQVLRLEVTARLLPDSVTAHGMVKTSDAMTGSQTLTGSKG
jgi:hypothetical protein